MASVAEVGSVLARTHDALLAAPSSVGHLWEDFASSAGSSSEWVTGFVLWGLGAQPRSPVVAAATKALVGRQRKDGSWGYCEKVPGDADSTAWALIGLGTAAPARRKAAALSYLMAQQVEGGFRTYSADAPVALVPWAPRDRHFRGWMSPHTCVTAVVVECLVQSGVAASSAEITAAVHHLSARQQPNGLWPSYWWSGVTYSAYQALNSLGHCGALTNGQLDRAVRELLARQQADGGWAWDGSNNGRPAAFETAFGLMSLELAFPRSAARGELAEAIERGADWLCHNQSAGGKWPSELILRVPLPSDPDEHLGAWQCRSRPGGLGADVKGVFSAAAVSRCLAGYLARRSPELVGSHPLVTPRSVVPPDGAGVTGPVPVTPLLRFLVVHEARAAYAGAMQARGLDIADEARMAVLSADRELARRIARRLPAIEGDHPGGRQTKGRQTSVFSARWRAKVISVLGFGAAMAKVLAAAQGLECTAEPVELSAVLLLGTAALDHVCDESQPLREELLDLLSVEVVEALCRGRGPRPGLAGLPGLADHADVRYVLRLVEAFFVRLDHWLEPGTARARAGSLLRSAYEAERNTISSTHASADPRAALRNGVAARTLPFVVMTSLNCGFARHGCAGRTGWGCDRPAELLGRAVAALDDLADVCIDVRTGAHNSLLLAAAASSPGDGHQTPSDLLLEVIATGACWTAARQVASASAELLRVAATRPSGARARQRLLAHLWGWGNLGQQPADVHWRGDNHLAPRGAVNLAAAGTPSAGTVGP
jgi:hypothetical protein